MKKIIATIIKEWLLMKRDISGLLLLLAMPAALIIIMALVQDAPFKDYQELRFDLLLADNDHGALARQITDGLKHSKNFRVADTIDGKPVTEEQVKQMLHTGNYKIGIVIPAGVTAEIVNSSNIVVNDISKRTGLPATLPTREMRDQMYVRLYFDPIAKPAFRTAIGAALDKFITYSCTNILMQRLSVLSKGADSTDKPDLGRIMQGVGIKEEPLNHNGKSLLHISSVQHNVPAWTIFGMFFIVIPIAGHIIREREDGSALRIALIPGAAHYVALGKIIFYTFVCTFQFLVMLSIGVWAMPLFGLPSLYLGLHPWVLLPIALCISFAATAFGFFAGTAFKTITQALPFGSISIVMLSAIGGIWVPVAILPLNMQHIALASPLYWAMEAMDQIILRDGDFRSVIFPLSVLLFTGTLLWIASIFAGNRQNNV